MKLVAYALTLKKIHDLSHLSLEFRALAAEFLNLHEAGDTNFYAGDRPHQGCILIIWSVDGFNSNPRKSEWARFFYKPSSAIYQTEEYWSLYAQTKADSIWAEQKDFGKDFRCSEDFKRFIRRFKNDH